jgi:hypothetical protein
MFEIVDRGFLLFYPLRYVHPTTNSLKVICVSSLVSCDPLHVSSRWKGSIDDSYGNGLQSGRAPSGEEYVAKGQQNSVR